MTLAEKLIALHEALARGEIPHAFGGAIALGYYTDEPRGTRDVDVNVFMPADEPGAALAALPAEVARPAGTEEKVKRDGQVRLWWEATPVDLFFDNLDIHRRAASAVRTVEYEGVQLPILGPVELTVFKMMFDRGRDWGDIEEMLAAGSLDAAAARELLASLIGDDDPRFERFAEAARRADARQV